MQSPYLASCGDTIDCGIKNKFAIGATDWSEVICPFKPGAVSLCVVTPVIVFNHARAVPKVWGVLCQKQVSRGGTSNYITKYMWDVITFPCSWVLSLVKHPWIMTLAGIYMIQFPSKPSTTFELQGFLIGMTLDYAFSNMITSFAFRETGPPILLS